MNDKFKLVCTSKTNLTIIKIFDELISLKKGMIIQLGILELYVKEIEVKNSFSNFERIIMEKKLKL